MLGAGCGWSMAVSVGEWFVFVTCAWLCILLIFSGAVLDGLHDLILALELLLVLTAVRVLSVSGRVTSYVIRNT